MDQQKWREFYQTADRWQVWVKVMTTDGEHFFFHEYDEWQDVKSHCEQNSVFIQEMHLQLRSHECIINIEDAEGIYFVRSVMGMLNGPTTNHYTIGVLRDGEMHKQMWLVPELLLQKEFVDGLEDCFEEAIIYNEEKKKNREEQVPA